jgi:replicative DNA helicase
MQHFSIESETHVIGCFIQDPTLLAEHKLNTEHFQDPRNRRLFETMYTMLNDDLDISAAALALECGDLLQHINFSVKLAPNTHNFSHNQANVIETWKRKEARNVLRLAEQEDFNPEDLPLLIKALEQIDEEGTTEEPDTNDVIDELMDLPYNPNEKYIGYKTGLNVLDKVTGGLRRRELSYWCARPSVGKTAVSVDLMKRLMFKGVAVLYFTFEMTKSGLLIRMLSNMAGIDSRKVPEAHKVFTKEDNDKWQHAGQALKQQTYEIVETVSNTNGIRTAARKFRKEHPNVDFVIMIDYLTKIKPVNDYGGNAHMQVTEISAELKEIAKDFDTHVACLAQLSRGVENRQDKRPTMADIRESGSVEQDGDVIGMLYREDYQTEEDNKADQKLEINIIKNRNGAVGVCNFMLNKPTGRLREVV